MGIKDNKHFGMKIGNDASYRLGFLRHCLVNLHQFDRYSRETCLARQYLLSIDQHHVEHQWRAILKQRCLKYVNAMMKALELCYTILEIYWKNM